MTERARVLAPSSLEMWNAASAASKTVMVQYADSFALLLSSQALLLPLRVHEMRDIHMMRLCGPCLSMST